MELRKQIYALLDPGNHAYAARRWRAFEIALILAGIGSVSAGTVDALSPGARAVAGALTGIVAALFFVEYLVRFWVAPEIPHLEARSDAAARVRWAVSAEGVIDLLAVIPALAVASGGMRLGAESAATFVLLWVLKLATYAPGVELIARVVRNHRSALAAAAGMIARRTRPQE